MTINPIQGSDAYVPTASLGTSNVRTHQVNFSASTSGLSSIAVEAPRFLTPVLKIDPKTQTAIYEQRDPNTGEVIHQYPSEKAVAQYQKADQQAAVPLTDAKTQSPAPTGPAVTAPTPVKVGTDLVTTPGVAVSKPAVPDGNLLSSDQASG